MHKPHKGRRFDLVGDLSGEPAIPLTFVRGEVVDEDTMRKPPKPFPPIPAEHGAVIRLAEGVYEAPTVEQKHEIHVKRIKVLGATAP